MGTVFLSGIGKNLPQPGIFVCLRVCVCVCVSEIREMCIERNGKQWGQDKKENKNQVDAHIQPCCGDHNYYYSVTLALAL